MTMTLDSEQKRLRLRILELSHEAHLSHLGSCLSAVDIIAAIYRVKTPDERFVLSAGHSGVALYAVLEHHGLLRGPSLHDLHVHPDRNPALGIDVSSGSLGQGLPIALGIALADRSRNVWVVSTDGEMTEGSMWEALRIASEQKLRNLKLHINANGFGAYGPVETGPLAARIKAFGWRVRSVNGHDPSALRRALTQPITRRGIPTAVIARTTSEQFRFLQGLDAHYYIMRDEDYLSATQSLET
jgi:transketolase